MYCPHNPSHDLAGAASHALPVYSFLQNLPNRRALRPDRLPPLQHPAALGHQRSFDWLTGLLLMLLGAALLPLLPLCVTSLSFRGDMIRLRLLTFGVIVCVHCL